MVPYQGQTLLAGTDFKLVYRIDVLHPSRREIAALKD